jgi:hypothetical protein
VHQSLERAGRLERCHRVARGTPPRPRQDPHPARRA